MLKTGVGTSLGWIRGENPCCCCCPLAAPNLTHHRPPTAPLLLLSHAASSHLALAQSRSLVDKPAPQIQGSANAGCRLEDGCQVLL